MKVKNFFIVIVMLLVSVAIIAFNFIETVSSEETVSQKEVVKTTPNVLYYDNMVPLQAKKETLSITNISGERIEINAFLELPVEFQQYLTIELLSCEGTVSLDSNDCTVLTDQDFFFLNVDSSQEVQVQVMLNEVLPDDLQSFSLENAVKVSGSVLASNDKDENIIIVPDNNSNNKDELNDGSSGNETGKNLSRTGVDIIIKVVSFISALLLIFGVIFITRTKHKNNKRLIEGEQ